MYITYIYILEYLGINRPLCEVYIIYFSRCYSEQLQIKVPGNQPYTAAGLHYIYLQMLQYTFTG